MGGTSSTEEKQASEAQLNIDRAALHSLSPTSALLHQKKEDPSKFGANNNEKCNTNNNNNKDGAKNLSTVPRNNNNNVVVGGGGGGSQQPSSSSSSSTSTSHAGKKSRSFANDENLKSFIACLRGPPRIPISLNIDPTIAGLVNYGNTCYANSVLQMLFHTPAFRHHVAERFAQQISDLSLIGNGEMPKHGAYSPFLASSLSSPSDEHVSNAKKLLVDWKDTVWFELASLFTKITTASEKAVQKATKPVASSSASADDGGGDHNSNNNTNNSNTTGGRTANVNNEATISCPIGNNTTGLTLAYTFPVVEPEEMIRKVRKTYFQFNNREQHDAHEFALNLLNTLFEEESKFTKTSPFVFFSSNNNNNNNDNNNGLTTSESSSSSISITSSSSPSGGGGGAAGGVSSSPQQLPGAGNLPITLRSMTGNTVTLTSCMECDTVTCVKENLIDVSCVLEQKSSIRHIAESFTNHEILTGENKFRCDCCGSSCVARRRTIVSSPAPKMLLVQMKRFRYTQHGVTKLNDFVPFSDCLRVPVYDSQNNAIGSQLYRLCAFVVHMGSYPMAGHYFCIAHHRTTKQWMILNDQKASIITERERMKYLGTCPDLFNADQGNNVTAYVLSYEKDDEYDERQEREEQERRAMNAAVAASADGAVVANVRNGVSSSQRQQQRHQQQSQVGGKKKEGMSTTTATTNNNNGRYESDVIV